MTSAVPEAASEPEETVTLLLGREPKTETLEVSLRDLTLIGSETLQGFLDCATTVDGSVIPLPDVDSADTMKAVLAFFGYVSTGWPPTEWTWEDPQRPVNVMNYL